MRRSLWLSLAVCAVLAAGCRPSGPADPPESDEAASLDVIDAVPLEAETPPPAAQTRAPVPGPAEPSDPTAPAPDAEETGAPAPSAGDPPSDSASCREAIGEAASARLVQRCIQVSPATRPPCNAANPCRLIQDEIDRSCKLWARDGDPPAECRP
ncbi:MAG: hypothetical protein A2352_09450 [Caulobacterales bacterium RIFOXYB1_FULL_67_16]|jgi:hypothetical protein|nr:MAG: hypothetical protein A2352_09450 [Caulobacterales bacterium RIFOXYB1_FULL_67_16]